MTIPDCDVQLIEGATNSPITLSQLNDGKSQDEKYKVNTLDGASFFLRRFQNVDVRRRSFLTTAITRARSNGVNLPNIVLSQQSPADGNWLLLSEWGEGQPLNRLLPITPEIEQRSLGAEFSQDLSLMHKIIPSDVNRTWPSWYFGKIEPELAKLSASNKDSIDELIRLALRPFATSLIAQRPLRLIHGDFQIANLIHDGKAGLIVDCESMSYADPWYDFSRIYINASVSSEFASGLVVGYFQNCPPIEFWELLYSYVAMDSLLAIAWGINHGYDDVVDRHATLGQRILEDSRACKLPYWFSPVVASSKATRKAIASNGGRTGLNVDNRMKQQLTCQRPLGGKGWGDPQGSQSIPVGYHLDRHLCSMEPMGKGECPDTNLSLLPKKVRIDASTICQLKCEGCGFQRNGCSGLGAGYLTADNFRSFIEDNPQIERVELSSFGEMFENPELINIMKIAYEANVRLEASMGVNFNRVTREQVEALVAYRFAFLSISIDGASQESYSKYRKGGDYDMVIENIRLLQMIKNAQNSELPQLQWQFIPNEYNELEIEKAIERARMLGMSFFFKLNYMTSYHPKQATLLRKATGLECLTRQEYAEKYNAPYGSDICLQMFYDPQINWDGELLGCCKQSVRDYSINVFEVGLSTALTSSRYAAVKKCLQHPELKHLVSDEYSCFQCSIFRDRLLLGKKILLSTEP